MSRIENQKSVRTKEISLKDYMVRSWKLALKNQLQLLRNWKQLAEMNGGSDPDGMDGEIGETIVIGMVTTGLLTMKMMKWHGWTSKDDYQKSFLKKYLDGF